MASEAERAARQSRREAERATRDAEAAEHARLDARVDQAAVAAVTLLPGKTGTALAALLNAMKPFRASDGHLSFSAIGRLSPEVQALALAILAVPASTDAQSGAEALAQRFHETYERLAPIFSYTTREASAKPWAEVPENNRELMTAVCAEILRSGATSQRGEALAVLRELVAGADDHRCWHIPAEIEARARAVLAAAPVPAQTRTEWAVWFDADDPNDPKADIFGKTDEAEARDALIGRESYTDPDEPDQPQGVCTREVTTITGPWRPVVPTTTETETKEN